MVSYKMTTDVGHISSELCLLGCRISTRKPPERAFQSFFLLKWRFVDSSSRGREVSHSRNAAPSIWSRDPTQVGASACSSSFISPGLSAHHLHRGSQLELHALQIRQLQCFQGPPIPATVSIRQFCPKATTLYPLATAGQEPGTILKTYLNFKNKFSFISTSKLEHA